MRKRLLYIVLAATLLAALATGVSVPASAETGATGVTVPSVTVPGTTITTPGVTVPTPTLPTPTTPTVPTLPGTGPSGPSGPTGGGGGGTTNNNPSPTNTQPSGNTPAPTGGKGNQKNSTSKTKTPTLKVHLSPQKKKHSSKKNNSGNGPLYQSNGAPSPSNPTFTDALPPSLEVTAVPNFVISQFHVPPFLLPIYQAAGIEYGIRWEVLAAINEIETDYGRNLNVSSAGAVGWMQFLPSTWKTW
ncbi:MAG TPA: lytic transglycosylase domain-containing protein, partial [Thermoleophilaceae bacterium]|nr:lytic transglycosylase domain-containing protein [Thermoleophilaceae bacterium]